MLNDSINIVDLLNEIYDILMYEKYINFKKENHIPLSKDELFFDTYIPSPTLMYNVLKS